MLKRKIISLSLSAFSYNCHSTFYCVNERDIFTLCDAVCGIVTITVVKQEYDKHESNQNNVMKLTTF